MAKRLRTDVDGLKLMTTNWELCKIERATAARENRVNNRTIKRIKHAYALRCGMQKPEGDINVICLYQRMIAVLYFYSLFLVSFGLN